LKKIETDKAPAAIGPYSQGLIHEQLIFTSGQIPISPVTGEIVGTTIEEQTEQVIRNLKVVLEAGGSCLSHVLKTTCFLADMNDFAAFNAIYAKHLTEKPARSTVGVKQLPKNVLVEIEAVAVLS
jgi:2-iminobutanoate/2-iminopropanoate deaminase